MGNLISHHANCGDLQRWVIRDIRTLTKRKTNWAQAFVMEMEKQVVDSCRKYVQHFQLKILKTEKGLPSALCDLIVSYCFVDEVARSKLLSRFFALHHHLNVNDLIHVLTFFDVDTLLENPKILDAYAKPLVAYAAAGTLAVFTMRRFMSSGSARIGID